MKNRLFSLFLSLAIFSCNSESPEICAVTDEARTYKEEGGVLVLEAESTSIPEGWALSTATSGFTGSGYLQWTGEESLSDPGNGVLSYNLSILTTGTYRFKWRTRINVGNDAWLRFPDAADFFGRKTDGSVVYPGGSGKTPNPAGQSKEGWFKVYQNQLDQWSTRASTSDNDPHDVFVTFDEVGVYQMELSGRSQGFAMDRIMLSQDNVPIDVTDVDLEVSEVGCD